MLNQGDSRALTALYILLAHRGHRLGNNDMLEDLSVVATILCGSVRILFH